jgi:hypothetical protein
LSLLQLLDGWLSSLTEREREILAAWEKKKAS